MTVLERTDDCQLESIDADALTATVRWPGGGPVRVDGVRLEQAFRFGAERLLVTSDEVPYEDGLHVVLVAEHGTVADELTFRAPYATGSFDLLECAGDALVFRFFADIVWRVTLLPRPALTLPFLGLPTGVRRLGRFTKRLTVARLPGSGG